MRTAAAQRTEPVSASPHEDWAVQAIARIDRFIWLLGQVLRDEDVARRLSAAGVSVQISIEDLPGTAITLLLDTSPARMIHGSGPEPPALRLWISSAQLEAVLSEAEYLPLQILAGAVRFEGPVRKFLRVMPILRDAAASLEREAAARSGPGLGPPGLVPDKPTER